MYDIEQGRGKEIKMGDRITVSFLVAVNNTQEQQNTGTPPLPSPTLNRPTVPTSSPKGPF